MSFPLPLPGTSAREACGDMAHLVEILDPRNVAKLPDFRGAISSSRKSFPAGAKSVNIVCLRANDERWLISIGPRGGWKFLWNFGTGRF